MRFAVNWLPTSLAATVDVARTAERHGFWGLGVCDSPRYGELYTSCHAALSVTERIVVTTSVTNPVTRAPSVHAAAARALVEAAPGRFVLGMGTGDSAVRTHGMRPATLAELERSLGDIRRLGPPDLQVLVAASGPRGAETAGRAADGIVCGAGRDLVALGNLAATARRAAASGSPEVWASLRLAVCREDAVDEARRSMLPRAISAARFNFASTFTGKNVPDEFAPVLRERFARYDFTWHGRAGANPNASLFCDRPDIEAYLLDRFVVVGTADQCVERLVALDGAVDGVFLSILFEDPCPEIARIGSALAAAGLLGGAPGDD